MTVLVAVLATGVGVLYAFIAFYLIPRLARLASRSGALARVAEYGAAALFLGCAVTHWSIAVHTLTNDADAEGSHVIVHLLPHVAQLVGGGLFVYAVLTAFEIHVRPKEEIEREQEATRQREQVERGQRLAGLGQLAGGIAHDFNNILTVILTYGTDTVERLADRPTERNQVQEMVQAATRGSDLTRQLLTFSQGGRPVAEPVALDASITRARPMLETAVGDRVTLEFDLDAADAEVMLGPGDLEQIVLNLVVNARDAMPDGGTIRIASTLDGSEPAGSGVRLTVTDTGIGMDPEVAARVFEPFYTTRGLEDGTGLGLSVVHGIVSRARGTISLESARGQGTRFDVVLRTSGRARLPVGVGVEGDFPRL